MSELPVSRPHSRTARITPGDLEERLQKAVERIVTEFDPERIILFGSHAYGKPAPDSDVDLMVIMETERRPAERILAISRLLSPRPFPVDIVVRTPEELARSLRRTDPFIHEIMERGRTLYARSRRNRRVDHQG